MFQSSSSNKTNQKAKERRWRKANTRDIDVSGRRSCRSHQRKALARVVLGEQRNGDGGEMEAVKKGDVSDDDEIGQQKGIIVIWYNKVKRSFLKVKTN